MEATDNISGNTASSAYAETPGALYNQIMSVRQSLLNAGFPDTTLLWYVIALIYHESDDLTSHVATVDHNYGGIIYVPGKYEKGLPRPASEGGYYAHFSDFEDFAHALHTVLSKKGKLGAPIDAANANDFGNRLYANGYFDRKGYATYAKNFNAKLRKIDANLAWAKDQGAKFMASNQTSFVADEKGTSLSPKDNKKFNRDLAVNEAENYMSHMWDTAKKHPLILGGVGVAVLLVLTGAFRRR